MTHVAILTLFLRRRWLPAKRLAVAWTWLAVGGGSGCAPRTVVLVDPCPEAGVAPLPSAFASCPRADASGDGATTTLVRGLVGHWRLDDGAGSTVAHDSSENGNNGTLATLDPSTAWVTGQVGPYALETAAIGYASVAKSATIDSIVKQVTLAAWLYLDGPINDFATAASRQIGNSLRQYYHVSLNSQARPNLFINPTIPGDQVVQPMGALANPVPPQQWTHLAGTYDGTVARLYVNGILVDSDPVTGEFGPDTTPVILGGNGNGNMISERFPGRIDEIVLYNRALDASEIGQLAAGVPF